MNLTGQGVYKKTTKDERKEDAKYLKWLRTQPCAICKAYPPSQACHIRLGGVGGVGMKPVFSSCPMCASCHSAQTTKATSCLVEKIFGLH